MEPLYTYKDWVHGEYVTINVYPPQRSCHVNYVKASSHFAIDLSCFADPPGPKRKQRTIKPNDIATNEEAFK